MKKVFLALLAAFLPILSTAQVQTGQVVLSESTSYVLSKGTTAVGIYTDETKCNTDASNARKAGVNIPPNGGTVEYICSTQKKYKAVYPVKPVAEVRQTACPTGTSTFTQTRAYVGSTAGPNYWIPGTWLPLTPPSNACTVVVPPPPTVGGPTLTANPTSYSGDGYSTITWQGTAPCVASSVPDYSVWSGPKDASGGQSVSPDVTTVLTLTCNGKSSSTTITVTNGVPSTGGSGGGTTNPPPVVGTPYPGYNYTLPTARPFISLAHYNISRTAPAYLRLKAQVDDAVNVTNNVPANATFDQLVNALNSGHYGYSVTDSVILYSLTNDPKYIQQAVKYIGLFIVSENARISAGTTPEIAGDSYLDVGPTMEQIALTYDYGYNLLTQAQRDAWKAYADQAIYNVWNYNNASWGGVNRPWSGWSVNDPGNNYFYSFLKATQLWALASQNNTWITYLQTNKYSILVPFLSQFPQGGTREGTGYGTSLGGLFDNYTYWKFSTGEDLGSYSNHAKGTIDYWIYATVPTFDYFASIGDQARSSMPIMYDYQRKIMKVAVALYPNTPEGQRGNWWLNRVKVTDGGNGSLTGMMRYNFNFRYDMLISPTTEVAPTALNYDATGTGVLFARSDWNTTASWMHTIAGVFDQSHAHQDQGSFSFYKNGWLTVTSNIYSSSGINQGPDVHNVIKFTSGGSTVTQRYNSVSTKTFTDVNGVLEVNENLSPAYSGTSVSNWTRKLTYNRANHSINVLDVCTVASGVVPTFQLHTPSIPVRQADGSYNAGRLKITPPANSQINIVDMRTSTVDSFSGGYRFEIVGSSTNCGFNVTLNAI